MVLHVCICVADLVPFWAGPLVSEPPSGRGRWLDFLVCCAGFKGEGLPGTPPFARAPFVRFWKTPLGNSQTGVGLAVLVENGGFVLSDCFCFCFFWWCRAWARILPLDEHVKAPLAVSGVVHGVVKGRLDRKLFRLYHVGASSAVVVFVEIPKKSGLLYYPVRVVPVLSRFSAREFCCSTIYCC